MEADRKYVFLLFIYYLVPGAIQLIQIIISRNTTYKDSKIVCMVGSLYSVGARGAIQLIQIIINESKTNKDNKTVCMVACLYSVGSRGNTFDSNNKKQKHNRQGQQDSVHGETGGCQEIRP